MSAPSELSKHAAALYRGALAEFTAERNRLATELKSRDKTLAAAVKALSKPSVSAWAVNQLFWHDEARFAAFLAAATGLRDALRSGAGPRERHVATREHRDAHNDLVARAQTILGEAGNAAAPALLRRIGTTLEAVATRGWPEPGPGCLAEDLDPPGFDDTFALGGFAPSQRDPARASAGDRDAANDRGANDRGANDGEAPAAPDDGPGARAREAAKKQAEARRAALAAAREEATRTARELDVRRRESDDAEAEARAATDEHDALAQELKELQRKVDRAASSRTRTQATAEARRERLHGATEDHERATAKVRALQDD